MSQYHVHARLFEGTLDAPTRNELQSRESDARDEVMELAEELAGRGFHVAVYSHDHGDRPDGYRAPYVVIAEWRTGGQRVR